MEEQGFITEVRNTKCVLLIVIVRRKNNAYGPTTHYRHLNKHIKDDIQTQPHTKHFSKLFHDKMFSKSDM